MNNESKTVQLSLSVAEINLVLEGLGTQPFARVFQLVGKIQQQAERQLSGEAQPAQGALAQAPGRSVAQ